MSGRRNGRLHGPSMGMRDRTVAALGPAPCTAPSASRSSRPLRLGHEAFIRVDDGDEADTVRSAVYLCRTVGRMSGVGSSVFDRALSATEAVRFDRGHRTIWIQASAHAELRAD